MSAYTRDPKEAILIARVDAARQCDEDEPGTIVVCRGDPLCTARGPGDQDNCPWCYVISSDDPRTTDEIITAMNRYQS